MKNKKKSAGQNIKVRDGEWSFSKIEKKFDKHINTSVPFYEDGHEIISNISTFFLLLFLNFINSFLTKNCISESRVS